MKRRGRYFAWSPIAIIKRTPPKIFTLERSRSRHNDRVLLKTGLANSLCVSKPFPSIRHGLGWNLCFFVEKGATIDAGYYEERINREVILPTAREHLAEDQ